MLLHIADSSPVVTTCPGRGFYQLEEDSLYVQIGPFGGKHRFFSYLESESCRLETDKEGRLVFLELSVPRRRWPVDHDLVIPANSRWADIRWLDFRTTVPEPRILTNQRRDAIRLQFADSETQRHFRLADVVVVSVDRNNHLTGLWVTDIIDDLAGQEIAAYRRAVRERGPIDHLVSSDVLI